MHGDRGKGGRAFHNNEDLGSDAMGGYSLEDYIYSLEARGSGERNSSNIMQSGMINQNSIYCFYTYVKLQMLMSMVSFNRRREILFLLQS